MIRGVHTMFYSSEPEAFRAFVKDIFGFPSTDVGEGWLIFDLPEAEMGCHPADEANGGASGVHDISFYCDNVEETAAAMKSKGVEFITPIEDHGYGFVTEFKMPGNITARLYQPKYTKNGR